MSRIRQASAALRTAATNMLHVLMTPREVLADEVAAREFCAKMRALGVDPAEALHVAATAAVAGLGAEEMQTFAKIHAQRAVLHDDRLRLIGLGYSIAEHRPAHSPALAQLKRARELLAEVLDADSYTITDWQRYENTFPGELARALAAEEGTN